MRRTRAVKTLDGSEGQVSSNRGEFDSPPKGPDKPCFTSDAQELVALVEDVASKVYGALGDGRVEGVYQQAMAVELRRRDISYRTGVQPEIFYEEERVGIAELDFIVEGRLVVELKATEHISETHLAQTKAHMRTTGLWNGLVVNFPRPKEEKPQFKHLVNDSPQALTMKVAAEDLPRVKPGLEKLWTPFSQNMRRAVEELDSAKVRFKQAQAEYEDMLSDARGAGFSEDEIEASESLNWRKVKPGARQG